MAIINYQTKKKLETMVISVAFYGNTCNNHYQIAKALRKFSNINAHVFLDESHGFQMLPESDDSELKDNYPDWIHKKVCISNLHYLIPWKAPLIEDLKKFDIVVLSFDGLIIAPYLKTVTIFYVTGGDLTISPFPFDAFSYYDSFAKKVGAIVRGWRQKKGIESVDQIWSQPFSPFIDAQNKLAVESKVSPVYFPVVMDANNTFSPSNMGERDEEIDVILRELGRKFDRYLFFPSRIKVDESPFMRSTGQWKNNNLFLEAVALFVEKHRETKIGLVLIDKIDGADNKDYVTIKNKIKDLGIEQCVEWLKPNNKGGFKRNQLVHLYMNCFAVADDFGVGWFGSIVLEGLSMSKPVFCYVDEVGMKKLYPWHPILSMRNPEEIAKTINKLIEDEMFYDRVGKAGRNWIMQYHDSLNVGKIYVERFLSATVS